MCGCEWSIVKFAYIIPLNQTTFWKYIFSWATKLLIEIIIILCICFSAFCKINLNIFLQNILILILFRYHTYITIINKPVKYQVFIFNVDNFRIYILHVYICFLINIIYYNTYIDFRNIAFKLLQ